MFCGKRNNADPDRQIANSKKSQITSKPAATKSAALSQDRPVGTTEFGIFYLHSEGRI
jgi:hypothetical protein